MIEAILKQLKCGHSLGQDYVWDYCPPCLTEMAKKYKRMNDAKGVEQS